MDLYYSHVLYTYDSFYCNTIMLCQAEEDGFLGTLSYLGSLSFLMLSLAGSLYHYVLSLEFTYCYFATTVVEITV